MTTLAYLNDLRSQLNKAPLKAWKASKADLALAIEVAQSLVDQLPDALISLPNGDLVRESEIDTFEASAKEIAAQVVRPHPDASSNEGIREVVSHEGDSKVAERLARLEASSKNKALKITPHADRKGVSSSPVEPFFLADVARALDIDPKLARVKARRHLTAIVIPGGNWSFEAKHYDAVVKVLTSDARKK